MVDRFGNVGTGTMDIFMAKKVSINKMQKDDKITMGSTTYTKDEWHRLMDKVDRYIKMIKKEQKAQQRQAQKDAIAKKLYAKQVLKAKEQKERLLKKDLEQDVTERLLASKERYMATPEELAKNEYEISNRKTGETYRYKKTGAKEK